MSCVLKMKFVFRRISSTCWFVIVAILTLLGYISYTSHDEILWLVGGPAADYSSPLVQLVPQGDDFIQVNGSKTADVPRNLKTSDTKMNGSKEKIEKSIHMNITIVTAFFDIGTFGKGSPNSKRSLDTYLEWAKTFRYLQNPLVAYTDSQTFFDTMKILRANLTDKTKLFLFDRNSSWAFELKDQIKSIYNIEGYPKHYPNTVIPEYSCAMHAKYDVVSRAAKANYFHTKYFAWLDIGLFRSETRNSRKFVLQLPVGFNSSKIAVNLVYKVSLNMQIARIIKEKHDWICGCIFLGERNLILDYTEQYKNAVNYFLSLKLMNSDQQVLYAMYSEQGRNELKTSINLQLYEAHDSKYDSWFYLGYIMRTLL